MPASISATARVRDGAAQVARASAAVASARSQRDQVARVESMVNGMETLARRISSNRLNGAQRTVNVARFNDLQRQVNRMDGIVVGEGRGDRTRGNVGRAMVARQTSNTRTSQPQQRRAQPRRSDDNRAAERARDAERVTRETVQQTGDGIRREGAAVVGERPDSERVVDLLA